MRVIIRALDRAEWQTYRDVRLAALRDSPEAFAGTLEYAQGLPEQNWRDQCGRPSWFAFQGDRAVGMVRVWRGDDRPMPDLISMWVDPSVRGTSAATELVEALLTWARAEGEPGVTLRVVTANERARAFYRRLGFVPNGVTDTLSDGRDEIEMELRFN